MYKNTIAGRILFVLYVDYVIVTNYDYKGIKELKDISTQKFQNNILINLQ